MTFLNLPKVTKPPKPMMLSLVLVQISLGLHVKFVDCSTILLRTVEDLTVKFVEFMGIWHMTVRSASLGIMGLNCVQLKLRIRASFSSRKI